MYWGPGFMHRAFEAARPGLVALGAQSAYQIWHDGCMWQQASTSPCWVGGSQTHLQAATGSTIRQHCSPHTLYDRIHLKSELLATP